MVSNILPLDQEIYRLINKNFFPRHSFETYLKLFKGHIKYYDANADNFLTNKEEISSYIDDFTMEPVRTRRFKKACSKNHANWASTLKFKEFTERNTLLAYRVKNLKYKRNKGPHGFIEYNVVNYFSTNRGKVYSYYNSDGKKESVRSFIVSHVFDQLNERFYKNKLSRHQVVFEFLKTIADPSSYIMMAWGAQSIMILPQGIIPGYYFGEQLLKPEPKKNYQKAYDHLHCVAYMTFLDHGLLSNEQREVIDYLKANS